MPQPTRSNGTLTSANAIITLTIPNLYSTPQQLQQFAADDMSDMNPIKTVETVMGVDGMLSGGFVYVEFEQGITLAANSPSNAIFDNWWMTEQQIQDALPANGVLSIPSISMKYILQNGFLSTYPSYAALHKILQPRKYTIIWNSCMPVAAIT